MLIILAIIVMFFIAFVIISSAPIIFPEISFRTILKGKQKYMLIGFILSILLGVAGVIFIEVQPTHEKITYETVKQIDLHSSNADSKGIIHLEKPLKIRVTKVVYNIKILRSLDYVKDITVMNNN